MKRLVLLGVAAATLGYGVVAQAGEIRIGATMRMISENGQKYGQMMQDEFDTINANGGINGHTIKLTLLNDECKSDKGVANANKFAYQEKVHLLIGSTCSSVSLPIVDVTAKAEVPQIIPHSTNHEITQKGSEWVFRVPISARFYKGVVAKYIGDKVGKNIAYVYASDAAAVSDAEGLKAQMKTLYDVDPVYTAQVQEKEIDFRSHMLKIKALNPDAVFIAALQVPAMAGDAIKGVFYTAAYSDSDDRPIAQEFNEMVRKKYGINKVDHDFSQAWDLVRIVEQALASATLALTDDSLEDDRTAIRDAIAGIENYEGLASGPISFCADPTPQCRDGNRTVVLIGYTKGGEDFEVGILDRVTMPVDFGLDDG